MKSVTAVGPNGGSSNFASVTNVSRVISGNGTDSKRKTIVRRCDNGGGLVGSMWVQYTPITN